MTRSKVLTEARRVLRLRHLAYSTERSYLHWIGRYYDAALTYPHALDSVAKLEMFLSGLAQTRVAASTQNQAFNALLFLYRHVLHVSLGPVNALRAKRTQSVRVSPTRDEVARLMLAVTDHHGYPTRLIVYLLYACGLRVGEPLRLRIKDVDLSRYRLVIRQSKGAKDRVVAIPASLRASVEAQLGLASALWEVDRRNGIPVPLPGRLATKYRSAPVTRSWYWMFPSRTVCADPYTAQTVRWHCHPSNVQRCVRDAVVAAALPRWITPHYLRHAYATHAIDAGASVRDVQSALGHAHLDTTMRYVTPDALRVESPFSALRLT